MLGLKLNHVSKRGHRCQSIGSNICLLKYHWCSSWLVCLIDSRTHWIWWPCNYAKATDLVWDFSIFSSFRVTSLLRAMTWLAPDEYQTQTQTQNISFNSNNHICKYKVKTEIPLGLFAFYSWKIFINVMQDLWEWHSGVSKSALKKCTR